MKTAFVKNVFNLFVDGELMDTLIVENLNDPQEFRKDLALAVSKYRYLQKQGNYDDFFEAIEEELADKYLIEAASFWEAKI